MREQLPAEHRETKGVRSVGGVDQLGRVGRNTLTLADLIEELELEVHMSGCEENPFIHMARAEVITFSSRWEGLSTALIEALAVGTSVVSTDYPGGSREILADGELGALVPVGSVTNLAAAIQQGMLGKKDPERLQRWATDFSVTGAADEYLSHVCD